MLIDKLLQTVVSQNASDLHLAVGRPPVIRKAGRLRTLNTKELTPEDTVSLMKSITPERAQLELQESGGADYGFAFSDKARFRVSVFRQKGNVGIVLRQIPTKLMTFEEIGVSAHIKDLLYRPQGLILVTGPTGSGKTTTLATMIDFINTELDRHVITIEDPIEYYHPHKKSVLTQREVGVDVPSFAEAVRRALRQDPDVILVGEMRDLETMEAAIMAAETGHLVFATLHTTGAQGTVNRIIDAFPKEQQEQVRTQLADSIAAVISQQLLPRADGAGRAAAFEILITTPAIQNLIRENKTYRIDSSIQTGRKFGMILLDDHLFELYEKGVIDYNEMIYKCRKEEELVKKVGDLNRLREQQAKKKRGSSVVKPS